MNHSWYLLGRQRVYAVSYKHLWFTRFIPLIQGSQYRVFNVQKCLVSGVYAAMLAALRQVLGFQSHSKNRRFKFLCFAQQKLYNTCFGWTSLIFGTIGFKPCISIWYWSLVSSAASSGVRGQLNEPSSKRLYKSKNPVPSQSRPLILSLSLIHI